MKNYRVILMVLTIALMAMSCQNGKSEFDDFDYSGAYFGSQYPVRTIVLGEDIFDNSLDNAHKFKVYANLGGLYVNKERVEISVEVDNSLCDSLYFEDKKTPIQPLPADYYTLASDKIVLDQILSDGVEVSLSDTFFTDPLALSKNYVLPLKMTNATNVDSVLSGVPFVPNAQLTNMLEWQVQPKNFVLYALKFINQYHGNYLRRGVDVRTDTTMVRHKEFVEDDDNTLLTTIALNQCEFSAKFRVIIGKNEVPRGCDLILTFNDAGECTISTTTKYFTVKGNGKFVIDGEKNSWGKQDRNALYLNYEISYQSSATKPMTTYNTTDTLVVRDRGVAPELFVPVCK